MSGLSDPIPGTVRYFTVGWPRDGVGYAGWQFPGGEVVVDGLLGFTGAESLRALAATMPDAQIAWADGTSDVGEFLGDLRYQAEEEPYQRGDHIRGWTAALATVEAVLGSAAAVEDAALAEAA